MSRIASMPAGRRWDPTACKGFTVVAVPDTDMVAVRARYRAARRVAGLDATIARYVATGVHRAVAFVDSARRMPWIADGVTV